MEHWGDRFIFSRPYLRTHNIYYTYIVFQRIVHMTACSGKTVAI